MGGKEDGGGDIEGKQVFSQSKPAANVWDAKEDDPNFIKMVKVELQIHMNEIDPKNGKWKASVRCNWMFRYPASEDSAAVRLVPTVRIPTCDFVTKEERIFKEEKLSTEASSFWRGISSFTLEGAEGFEVADFPFDRQLIDLKVLDFRWMPEHLAMEVVELQVKTISSLPSWVPYMAIVEAKNMKTKGPEKPFYAGRFNVKLRFERKPQYYITNIFLVTCGILLGSLLPLGMPAGEDIGDRLGVYAGGMLTLVAFKYGVAEQLPSVPYATVADFFLLAQIGTLVFAMVEALVVFRLVAGGTLSEESASQIEDVLLIVVVAGWMAYLVWVAVFKARRRRPWKQVLASQDEALEEQTGS